MVVKTLSGHLDPILGPMASKMLAIIHSGESLEILGVIARVWAVHAGVGDYCHICACVLCRV